MLQPRLCGETAASCLTPIGMVRFCNVWRPAHQEGSSPKVDTNGILATNTALRFSLYARRWLAFRRGSTARLLLGDQERLSQSSIDGRRCQLRHVGLRRRGRQLAWP